MHLIFNNYHMKIKFRIKYIKKRDKFMVQYRKPYFLWRHKIEAVWYFHWCYNDLHSATNLLDKHIDKLIREKEFKESIDKMNIISNEREIEF